MKSVSIFFVTQILILKVYILLNVLFSTKIMHYKYNATAFIIKQNNLIPLFIRSHDTEIRNTLSKK